MPVRRALWLVPVFPIVAALACGGRTTLPLPEERDDAAIDTAVPPECTRDDDCEGAGDKCAPITCVRNKCVVEPTVACDDRDPCTDDACDPATGACEFKARTLDLDGDGHKGPLPGKRPTEPDACGDDCDDKSPAAFPGNKEICDGVDNDCNGVVDDDMHYVPPPRSSGDGVVQISAAGFTPAGPAGLAWNGETYLAGYNGSVNGKTRVFTAVLDPEGKKSAESQITNVTADAFEGRVVWNGAQYGAAWSDRRTGSWEVFFNRLSKSGEKLGPDVQVSGHETWSINIALQWTGQEFAIAWQDQRDLDPDFGIWGQRLDVAGKAIGPNVKLMEGQGGSPEMGVGLGTIALVWTTFDGKRNDVRVRILQRDLTPITAPMTLTTPAVQGVFPVVVWNDDRYVIAFYDPSVTATKKAIYGTAIDESGRTIVPLKQLTDSTRFSRYPSLLPLGDRNLLVFADTKDSNGGYELYSKMLAKDLSTLGTERRITTATGDSIFPVASFGPQGNVGVLFRDDRLGALHVFFTNLVCQAAN